ncbi:MAG: energy transducer TonB [Cyclobacteriaceae bacterium]
MKITFLLLFFVHLTAFAQDSAFLIATFPDERYEGGVEAFYQDLGRNLKYPRRAREQQIYGTSLVAIVLDARGNTNVEILNSLGEDIDRDVLRVFKQFKKKWLPSAHKQTQKVRMHLIITYELNSIPFTVTPFDKNLFLEEVRVIAYDNAKRSYSSQNALAKQVSKLAEEERFADMVTYLNKLISMDPFEPKWLIMRAKIYTGLAWKEAACRDYFLLHNVLRYKVSDQIRQQYCVQ